MEFHQKEPCLPRIPGGTELGTSEGTKPRGEGGMSAVARAPGTVDLSLFYFFILYLRAMGNHGWILSRGNRVEFAFCHAHPGW